MKTQISRALVLTLLLGAGPALAQAPDAPAAAPDGAPAAAPAPAAPAGGGRAGGRRGGDATPGGDNGPARTIWAAQKNGETPYKAPNKPIWHIADILKAHKGQARWEQKVVLTRDVDARYVQMAPGDKSKCQFYADDRAWGWVYSGQVKVTIDGQEPKVIGKGWAFNVAPRLAYCLETVGDAPVVFYRATPAGQLPSFPESETPTPVPGYHYVKGMTTSAGSYDALNLPFFNVDEYGDSTKTGGRFLHDGHTCANLNVGQPLTELPPSTQWGHFHENMVEFWVDVYGKLDVLISGIGLVEGSYGDVISANEGRWHRATAAPNSGKMIRLAQTPRCQPQFSVRQLGATGGGE
jgi:hypothetical protein